MRNYFYASAVILLVLTVCLSIYSPWFLILLALVIAYTVVGIYDCLQKENNVNRNFPVVGHIKQLLVNNRELLQDWIFENERELRPFDRIQREIVYHRADNAQQTVAFGTRYSYHESGYEWMLHSNHPSQEIKTDLRISVGGEDCTQPYSCSILNVGGMSYGSISKNATMALNGGARLGNFASNTGEGGLTDYHLHYGGDLIFQFGTGYFGCRTPDGGFDEEEFIRNANTPQVKMIEIKISQGAKPGYGAILPGIKITEEIARIRDIKPGVTIISPPAHTAFSTPVELMHFIKKLRTGSGGKPIGFKFCLGKRHEVIALCKAMLQTGIMPDFITIDGAEGGTGAAHYESANWVGMPLEDAIPFVHDVLKGFGLKKHIRLFAGGKIISAFHIVRYLALGADACYSARGMMFALGCVQALQCDRDTCPTGITTTNENLIRGLVTEDKKQKVYNYHRFTLNAVKDMLVAAGLKSIDELNRSLICRRTGMNAVTTLKEIYPPIAEGSLLTQPYPEEYKSYIELATAESFQEIRSL
jgi:glutamate synthase domain-containing protein 2